MIHAALELPAQVYHEVERIAKAKRKPTAQVLRDFVSQGIANDRQQKEMLRGQGLADLANLGIVGGPHDLASHLDDYLYGTQK